MSTQKLVIYGEYSQLGKIEDNIMLSCHVKYILQSNDVKECPSFENTLEQPQHLVAGLAKQKL